jgi:D-alanyl-D-alanine carboxypeptidase
MRWFLSIGLALIPSQDLPDARPAGEAGAHFDRCVTTFMERHELPGLSIAVARQGELVASRAYGWADEEERRRVTPRSLFRIASVSKPITAVGVLKLIEDGELALDDRVFGKQGLLRRVIRRPEGRVDEITVEHLLRHTAGEPWGNAGDDPMFRWDLSGKELIRRVHQECPIEAAPGTTYSYSNFGYSILGRVIEEVTGDDYEEWILENVLAPCGIETMQVGAMRERERPELEVTYYDSDGGLAPEFGVRRMDAHGGWIASAEDLVRFALSVDGVAAPADQLGPESLAAMTRATFDDNGYGMGWSVNRAGNYWHGGSLPGTASMLAITRDGFCWAILVNKRSDAPEFSRDLDALFWNIRAGIPAWK